MPDYMFLLESRLSPEQRAVMMRVQELAAAMGFNLYLTGGTVRDLITGASLRDLDFTVEGNPSKMARERYTNATSPVLSKIQRVPASGGRIASRPGVRVPLTRRPLRTRSSCAGAP